MKVIKGETLTPTQERVLSDMYSQQISKWSDGGLVYDIYDLNAKRTKVCISTLMWCDFEFMVGKPICNDYIIEFEQKEKENGKL